MTRTVAIAALAALGTTVLGNAAFGQATDAPLVLTPPGLDAPASVPTPPRPPAQARPPATVAIPPIPHLRPQQAGSPPAVADAAPPAADLPPLTEAPAPAVTPPTFSDEDFAPLPTGDDPSALAAPQSTPPELTAPTTNVALQDPPNASVPREPDMAFGAFQRGFYLSALSLAIPRAEAGDTAAQTLLGLIYEGGYGVPRDEQLASDWYRFAADGGDRQAQFALGMMYLDGRGVPRDPAKAADLFEKAAASGEISSTYNLAILYLQGTARPADPVRAAVQCRPPVGELTLVGVVQLGLRHRRPRPRGWPWRSDARAARA